MSVLPLYLGDALAPDTFEATIMGLQVLKAVIGMGIAVIAYRGYRNNQSRPMLFLAMGFILVLGMPFVLYVGGLSAVVIIGMPAVGQAIVIALAELCQLAGLVAILHALRL